MEDAGEERAHGLDIQPRHLRQKRLEVGLREWQREFLHELPALYGALGIYLPLLAINCAIIGGSLFMVERQYDLTESTVYGIGTGIGWALAIVALAAIRERLRYANVPEGLQGLGIAFIVTGLLSMAFSAFVGVRVL